MTYTLTITIKFYDYWHCGSGNTGGNEADALVVRYDNGKKKGLPYVPAKTLKGLMREMADIHNDCDVKKWFGKEGSDNGAETYLTNGDIVDDIVDDNIPFLFKIFKNTALENGIARDNSLREIEAVIPLEVQATFSGVTADDTQLEALENAICSIKRIGLGRNRGMGRCEVSVGTKEVKS